MAGSVEFLQESFAGGETSPRVHGRVRTELYGKSLRYSENWVHLPQGPILMRGGTWHVDANAAAGSRLLPFRLLGAAEDYVLALSAGALRIYSRAGRLSGVGANLITNPTFEIAGGDAFNIIGWTTVSQYVAQFGDGLLLKRHPDGSWGRTRQGVAVVPGTTYTVKLRAYSTQQQYYPANVHVRIGSAAGGGDYYDGTSPDQNVVLTFVATGPTVYIDVAIETLGSNLAQAVFLGGPELRDQGAPVELATPWSGEQVRNIQIASEPAKNRAFLVHPNVAPQVLTLTDGIWALAPAVFTGKPATWDGANWPGIAEMFQGRLVLGATPNEPNQIWGSKAGNPLDFTTGATPADGYSWTVSTKGRLRWMQGQKALLLGDDLVEHSVQGPSGVITGTDAPDVRDESAWGSAAVQGVHIGDQVLFVTRDRRDVRTLSYSLNDDGWVSAALTLLADHMTRALVKELHYARSPFPILVALLESGEVVACTYVRAEQVLAWWRVQAGAPIDSAAVADTPDGSEVWFAVQRGGVAFYERLPLHEVGVTYVDSAKAGFVAGDGTFAGLGHLEGQAVRVLVDGALYEDQVVGGGQIQVDAELVGQPIVVGLPFRAKAVTLPPEGGNPRGTSQRLKRRWIQGFLRLNESALPLVNGERAPDRSPSSPMDAAEPLLTGDVGPFSTDWGDGTVTIEQDLPFRTEILAMFGALAQSEV